MSGEKIEPKKETRVIWVHGMAIIGKSTGVEAELEDTLFFQQTEGGMRFAVVPGNPKNIMFFDVGMSYTVTSEKLITAYNEAIVKLKGKEKKIL